MFVNSEKNSKIGAVRCQILGLKCTKFAFCWGSTPDPTVGDYRTPPVLKGPTSKGREEGEGKGKGRKCKGDGRGEVDGEI